MVEAVDPFAVEALRNSLPLVSTTVKPAAPTQVPKLSLPAVKTADQMNIVDDSDREYSEKFD